MSAQTGTGSEISASFIFAQVRATSFLVKDGATLMKMNSVAIFLWRIVSSQSNKLNKVFNS